MKNVLWMSDERTWRNVLPGTDSKRRRKHQSEQSTRPTAESLNRFALTKVSAVLLVIVIGGSDINIGLGTSEQGISPVLRLSLFHTTPSTDTSDTSPFVVTFAIDFISLVYSLRSAHLYYIRRYESSICYRIAFFIPLD